MKYFDSINCVRNAGLQIEPILEREINFALANGDKLALKDGWLAIVSPKGELVKNLQMYGNIVVDE
ncbi:MULTISPECIES: hypothetical protein [Lactobacillales]|uniref:hypothetical protein n=1 Tax=Lactobacillales TaxID=186826 RepID=UPI002FCA0ECC